MIIDSTKAPMTQNHCYTQPFIELFNEDCLQTLSRFEDSKGVVFYFEMTYLCGVKGWK